MDMLCCLTPPRVRALPGQPLLCDGLRLEVNGRRVDIMIRKDDGGLLEITPFQRNPGQDSLIAVAFVQRAAAKLGLKNRTYLRHSGDM